MKSESIKTESKTSSSIEAIKLLKADHKAVSKLFSDYENATTKDAKKKIVSEICMELSVHAQVEEEIFYPAVKEALKDHELVPEATVEHSTLKSLIDQIEGKEPDGDMYNAKVKVLSEYVKHHVDEEQKEMFPKAMTTKIDMLELGEKIASRKIELIAERT